jgi:protein-arginine kinase activator protein McsA
LGTADARKHIRSFIEEGLHLIETAGGAGLGLALGGPVGAMAGPLAAGFIIRRFKPLMRDLLERQLSGREQARVVCVWALAEASIKERLDKGELPRDDGFFSSSGKDWSSADNLVDGVLRTAQREHEELKIPYLAKLIECLTFSANFDDQLASHLLGIAESLSYEQFVTLSIFAAVKYGSIPHLRKAPLGSGEAALKELSLAAQIEDLIARQLLDRDADSQPYLGQAIVVPSGTRLSTLGSLFVDALGLGQISGENGKIFVRIQSVLAGNNPR